MLFKKTSPLDVFSKLSFSKRILRNNVCGGAHTLLQNLFYNHFYIISLTLSLTIPLTLPLVLSSIAIYLTLSYNPSCDLLYNLSYTLVLAGYQFHRISECLLISRFYFSIKVHRNNLWDILMWDSFRYVSCTSASIIVSTLSSLVFIGLLHVEKYILFVRPTNWGVMQWVGAPHGMSAPWKLLWP